MKSPRRLATRIVAASLGLLLLVQAAGYWAIRESIERNAEQSVADELAVGRRVWQRLLNARAQAMTQSAGVLAADYGFRSAVASGDPDTLGSALENQGARIGARISAWVDLSRTVVGVHDVETVDSAAAPLRDTLARVARRITHASPAGTSNTAVALVGGQPVQFVAAPMRTPLITGWVVMGFPVDRALADDLQALSGLDVAIVVAGVDGALQRVAVSTLSPQLHDALAASPHHDALAASPQVGSAAASSARPASLRVGGRQLLVQRVPLDDAAAGVLLLRSVEAAVARYDGLQWWLAAITLAGLAVFAFGSHVAARRVTTPLQALVQATRRFANGDYVHAPEHTGRGDEIGDLARAFDDMRVDIAAHQAEVRQLAYCDRLTGLPNRVAFREAVAREIAAARPCAVVMLDLDRFKHVNDVLGYAFGDQLLRATAGRLSGEVVREGDLVARLSGDEFGLLLPGSDAVRALAVAARIVQAFQQPLVLEDQTVDLTAGFGIACWPQHAADADTVLARAEAAMYFAKRKTTQVVVYEPGIDGGSALTLSLLSDLRRALELGELRLFLQPKLSLADGRIVGAEALVRWQHPVRGMVPPLQFIPFAEQTGFVRQLTQWIFEETVRQWPLLRALGVRRISVNLSTRDLLDQDLLTKLQQVLQRHGARADTFCLEITESAIMDEPQRAEAMLGALHRAGFKLSIDDFGTGYSSLAYLRRLPVDELKIDKSFVLAMEHETGDAKIVRSTIDLAHSLGLSVVAEGVETAAVWALLQGMGCDEAQGFHMSRPLPAADFAAFAAGWQQRVGQAVGCA